MKKRFLALAMASVLAISSFTACQSSNDEQSSKDEGASFKEESSQTESSEEEAQLYGKDLLTSKDEPVVISLMMSDSSDNTDTFKVWDYIKDACNVEIDAFAVVTSDYNSKLQTVFLSDAAPDIITHYQATIAEVSSDLLVPISQYEDQMPTYTACLEELGARDAVDSMRFYDGEYYTLPRKLNETTIVTKQWSVRSDIFEENNIAIPTTMDEVYEAGLKLLELYPDSAPITNRFGANNILSGIAAGFGTTAIANQCINFDYDLDQWVFEPATQEWKEMVTYVKKIYDAGVLDKEFTTVDTTTYEQKITQGSTFMMYDWFSNNAKYNANGVADNENFNVEIITPVQGPNGDYALAGQTQWNTYSILHNSVLNDEEHFAEILAFNDWLYSDEASVICSFGVEGESFKITEDGHYAVLDPSIDYFHVFGINKNCITGKQELDAVLDINFSQEERDIIVKVGKDQMCGTVNPTSPLNTDEYDESQIYLTTLFDYVDSSLQNFIFGARPIEEYDAFVAECVEKGSEKVTELYNNACQANK